MLCEIHKQTFTSTRSVSFNHKLMLRRCNHLPVNTTVIIRDTLYFYPPNSQWESEYKSIYDISTPDEQKIRKVCKQIRASYYPNPFVKILIILYDQNGNFSNQLPYSGSINRKMKQVHRKWRWYDVFFRKNNVFKQKGRGKMWYEH